MVRIADELKLSHIVECHNDVSYVAGRDNHSKLRLFLVFNGKGSVYVRNGKSERWEVVDEYHGNSLRQAINTARSVGIATYRYNGTYQSFMG